MQSTTTLKSRSGQMPRHWHDVLPVHDAANLFPLIGKDELRELAGDIAKNGMLEKVAVHFDQEGKCQLLDGRNRLDALQSLGRKLFDDKGNLLSDLCVKIQNGSDAAIVDFIVSKNIHRRHLTVDQRRELAARLLRGKPETSNLQIARQAKCDDKTVAKIRTELEATSEIPKLKKTVGKDGKARPARKARTTNPAKSKSTVPLARLATGGLHTLWDAATPEQRSKFVDGVGLKAIFAAAPRNLQELFLAEICPAVSHQRRPT